MGKFSRKPGQTAELPLPAPLKLKYFLCHAGVRPGVPPETAERLANPKLTLLAQLIGRHLLHLSARLAKKVSDLPAFLNSFTGVCAVL
jgi:hypothetical protein